MEGWGEEDVEGDEGVEDQGCVGFLPPSAGSVRYEWRRWQDGVRRCNVHDPFQALIFRFDQLLSDDLN